MFKNERSIYGFEFNFYMSYFKFAPFSVKSKLECARYVQKKKKKKKPAGKEVRMYNQAGRFSTTYSINFHIVCCTSSGGWVCSCRRRRSRRWLRESKREKKDLNENRGDLAGKAIGREG